MIAHRGANREHPENTMPAFLRALEVGADGIELDVHCTRDGVVVVHHDAVVHATSMVGSLRECSINALSYEELSNFAAGEREIMPTLGAVLGAVGARAEVFVELKGREIEDKVLDVIAASPAPDHCPIHSFDHDAIKRARRHVPLLRTGILVDRRATDAAAILAAAEAEDFWAHWTIVDERLVTQVHGFSRRSRVIAWTVNDAQCARRLSSYGVDGLCTDDVPFLSQALSE